MRISVPQVVRARSNPATPARQWSAVLGRWTEDPGHSHLWLEWAERDCAKAHAPPSAMSGAQGRPFRRGSAHRWLFSRAVDRYCPAVVTGSLVIGQWTPVPHPRKGDERVWGPKSGLASSRRRQVLPQRGYGPSPTTSAGLAAGGAGQRCPRSPSWPPSLVPRKLHICRENCLGGRPVPGLHFAIRGFW
jgi:hypothetical protein